MLTTMLGLQTPLKLQRMTLVLWWSALTVFRVLACKRRYPNQDHRVVLITQKWARSVLECLNIRLEVRGNPNPPQPCIVVSNHLGYLDVLVFMACTANAFVAKKSVARWIIFGPGAAAIGTVFVDRESPQSRAEAAQLMAQSVLQKNKGIVIFPEGTSSLEGKPWRHGAFRIAQEYKIPIQAARLTTSHPREVAYIGDDTFLVHLWRLLNQKNMLIRLEFQEPKRIEDAAAACANMQNWVQTEQRRELIKN